MIENLKNQKSPGIDGLTAEIIKVTLTVIVSETVCNQFVENQFVESSL